MQVQIELSRAQKLKLLSDKLDAKLRERNVDLNHIQLQAPKPVESVESHIEKAVEKEGDQPLKKTKKIAKPTHNLRKAAGLVWEDKTMEQWSEKDYRIFCGNLGNEVSDEILATAFRKYHSFQKAKVIRDKRTGKSRGYGFVSLSEPTDFLNALKDVNGQYVGNRPVKLTKSNWKDRDLQSEKNKLLPSDFQTNSQKQTNQICVNYKYVSPF